MLLSSRTVSPHCFLARHLIGWALICASMAPPAWADELAEPEQSPWPAPVAGWQAPAAGEHPRLFFRRADIPDLRKRADTPEGRAILARLKTLLGGGEAMPKVFGAARQAYDKNEKKEDLPVGTYTLWHGAGFGLLYQVTGESKYADLGRQCVEKAFDGQRDRDDRYSWVKPGGALRAGPSIGAIAMAYDLCYDGWDEEFRTKVGQELQNYDQDGGAMTLRNMALTPKHPPGSNHYGCQVGGAALAVLAIMGDPGTDEALLQKYLTKIEANTLKALTQGFGDGGYFWEHLGPSGIASDTALVPALQAMRVAGGKDFISPRPNARYITMRWAHDILPRDGQPHHPLRHPSSYGTEVFTRSGISRVGQFAHGFGAIQESDKPALLWVYQNFVEPGERQGILDREGRVIQKLPDDEKTYDGVLYPHRAVLAFINWPIGIDPKNPSEVLSKARQDSVHGYYVFRNRWQDENDILVTALLGARPDSRTEPIMVWGLGMRTTFPLRFVKTKAIHFDSREDGSGVLSVPGKVSFAVDFSKASGADVLVVMGGGIRGSVKEATKSGPGGASTSLFQAEAGGNRFVIMTLQAGQPPEVRVEGEEVLVGGQSITFTDDRLVLAK